MSESGPHLTTTAVAIDDLLAHSGWLRKLARSLVRDDAAAEDLVQETWLSALRSPPREHDGVRSWLSRVVRRKAYEAHRKSSSREARESAVAGPDETARDDDIVARAETQRALIDAVLALEEPFRATVLLHHFEELPPRAVAARMGVPVETVRSRLRRARERLRQQLDEGAGRDGAWTVLLAPLLRPSQAGGALGGSVGGASAVIWGIVMAKTTKAAVAAAALLLLAWGLVGSGDAEPGDEMPRPAEEPAVEESGPTRRRESQPAPPEQPGPPGQNTPDTDAADSEAKPDAAVDPVVVRRAVTAPLAGDAELLPRVPFAGLARLGAVAEQPVGMSEADVLSFLQEDLKTNLTAQPARWEKYWNEIFTLMTPGHTQTVPTVWMGRYEVTNAQWQRFLEHPYNQQTGQTGRGYDTLAAVASAIWGHGKPLEGADRQRAWIYLLERNRDVLMPILNPEQAEDWDPLVARAGEATLPPDLDLAYTTYLPPTDWVKGEVPVAALKRPARGISWEAANDFCRWAGLHLPTGAEWERAARGEVGRRFARGDEWQPLNLVWRGFNQALAAADPRPPALEPLGTSRTPSHPADVDSFPLGATPEGIHHLHGNVSEWILDLPRPYAGSKTKFAFETFAYGARGGNYQDRAEVMLAADRIWDGPGGEALRPGMELDGFGFRTSAYALDGADLTKPVELLFDDQNATRGPPMWMPTPFGLKGKLAKSRSEHFALMGFSATGTAGVIQRNLCDGGDHRVYVQGPAKSVAFLPVKGFASSAIRAKGDLKKFAEKDDAVVLLGILVGTPDLSFTIRLPFEVDERGKVSTEIKKKTFSFDDDRFIAPDGSFSKGFRYLGAFLVLTENGIAVFPPDSSNVGNADDYLSDESNALGYVIEPHLGDWQKVTGNLMREPSASIDDGSAVLTFVIPPLDEKTLAVKRSRYAVRMTITVPIEGW